MAAFSDFLRLALGWLGVPGESVPGCVDVYVLPVARAACWTIPCSSLAPYVIPAGKAAITLEVC